MAYDNSWMLDNPCMALYIYIFIVFKKCSHIGIYYTFSSERLQKILRHFLLFPSKYIMQQYDVARTGKGFWSTCSWFYLILNDGIYSILNIFTCALINTLKNSGTLVCIYTWMCTWMYSICIHMHVLTCLQVQKWSLCLCPVSACM